MADLERVYVATNVRVIRPPTDLPRRRLRPRWGLWIVPASLAVLLLTVLGAIAVLVWRERALLLGLAVVGTAVAIGVRSTLK